MQSLLTSDLAGTIISTIGAIVVAIITKKGTDKLKSKEKKKVDEDDQPPGKSKKFLEWVIIGIAAAVTFAIINLAYDYFTPKPTVEITFPRNGEGSEVRIADTGSGSFPVSGNSTRVIDKSNLRVFVLVHPADPFAEGWWLQPSVVMNSDGTWSGQAWIGGTGFPPNVGDLVDIVAIAANPEQVQGQTKVSDPKDLNPSAQSSVIRFDIKSTK